MTNQTPSKEKLALQPKVAGTAPIRRIRIARLPLSGRPIILAPAKAA